MWMNAERMPVRAPAIGPSQDLRRPDLGAAYDGRMKSDLQLHVDVAEALRFDPRIDDRHVSIAVSDGVVTLTGTVPAYPDLLAAQDTVKQISGVRAVAEDIRVEVPSEHRRDDTDIAARAADALAWHVTLPEGLRATVREGRVILEGHVDWPFQRTEAFGAVSHLAGVRAVENLISVRQQNAPTADAKV
jgi:osmotically-inducible protein OsmY